jgi:uncharacterized protein YndB with AHSA1/START domain
MTDRSVSHGSFVVERWYPAVPARVFAAWTDAGAKQIWMDDPDYLEDETEYELDFRVGGYERFGGLTPDGKHYRCDARYYDIVPGHRIVYSYEMQAGGDLVSVSLTTVVIVTDGDGTRLTYTEQGVFVDGIEKPEEREQGCISMLDNLGKYLDSAAGGGHRRE